MGIEQLSRELGDSRRVIASLVDQAEAIAVNRAELAVKREGCDVSELVDIDIQLKRLTISHSALVAEISIKAIETERLEVAMSELRYSQV